MKKILLALLFSSGLYAQTSIETSQDISVYDENNDGITQFDLTANSMSLLEDLDPNEYKISYFLTFKDADVNANMIPDPSAYKNVVPKAQELYARVTEIADPKNYSVELFTIRTHTFSGSSQMTASKNIKAISE